MRPLLLRLALLLPALVTGCTPEPRGAAAGPSLEPRAAAPPPATAAAATAPPATAAAATAPAATTPAAAEIRYLALGDSFTIGTGSSPAEAFPARLAARFRARGRAVALENLGVNGYATDDLIARELPRVGPFAPTLVTLAVGANDLVRGGAAERYRAQVRRILAAIVAAGVPAARVVALPQPDWSLSPAAADFGSPRAIAAQIAAFNAILREEATAVGARYVDLFPLMHRQAEAGQIAPDGLHPAASAHDAWAEELARVITP